MARKITNYRPDLPDEDWHEIADVVREAVRLGFPENVNHAQRMLYATTGYVHRCRQLGHDLDPKALFRPIRIDEYIHHLVKQGEFSEMTITQIRTVLNRIAATYDPLLRRVVLFRPTYDQSSPYDDEEILELRRWAWAQRTPYRRASAHILLALGFGAGCSIDDYRFLTVGDVGELDGQVTITVDRDGPFVVPLSQPWGQVLTNHMDASDPDAFVFCPRRERTNKNIVTAFIKPSSKPPVQLTQQRMRSTWIVRQVHAGIAIDAVMKAAGLNSASALSRYLVHLPERSSDEHYRLLLEGAD